VKSGSYATLEKQLSDMDRYNNQNLLLIDHGKKSTATKNDLFILDETL